ncbi:TIGR04551 family protein [Vulgatibacter incomptus]|uniref:TIGR04551 family protein n=1 Tax=Vulgatibacter incomptus TaxID=1391653 RepID=A0A0K1PF93_9BACT|nr:TIGR04551 family protein [Vulgatibacter incomptus]AKU91774.1 hypothetical protein AKJ08_2161 [Vulgatibacter incomptus]
MTRLPAISTLALILTASAAPALAQTQVSPPPAPPPANTAPGTSGSTLSAAEREAIREEIRRQLQGEMQEKLDAAKEEMRDEVRAAVTSAGAAQEWSDEWQEVRPKLDLFEVNGYFRTRGDLFYRFDMDTGLDPSGNGIFPIDPQNTDRHTQATTNMRLRINPTLNVSEDVRLKAQVDVFDNLVWGSTPNAGFSAGTGNQRNPWNIGSDGQGPPRFGFNSITDSITAKRVWAEVRTPVGELRFGRMADDFGLGMNINDGNCLDCDHGNTVDRVLFATKIFNHVIAPSLDFVSEGPTSANPFTQFPTAQPFDRTQADDARDWILTILRRDSDDEIRKLQAAGRETFVNYGLRLAYRIQTWDAPLLAVGGSGNGNAGGGAPQEGVGTVDPASFVARRAWTLTPDVWFRLIHKKYRLEFEFVTVHGKFNVEPSELEAGPIAGEQVRELTLAQYGAVLQNELKLADDKLALGLELGYASGGNAPGFGNFPGRLDPTVPGGFTQRGDWDGPQFNCGPTACPNRTINNFRFNRDYRVDLILFREILGGVTDAIYVRPSIRYDITTGLDVNFAGVYSQAAESVTTPTQSRPLGVELDTAINYLSDDGFVMSLAYGVLFPLSGLDQLVDFTNPAAGVISAKSAQTVRLFLGVVY